MPARRPSRSEPGGEDPTTLVVDTIREHAAGLLAMARRYSLCPDDAQDAYQRAVEIFIKRAHRLDREGAASWLRTVVKHEALAVRAGRQRLLAGGDIDLQDQPALHSRGPEERAADTDHLTRSAEALQRLKPHEVRALLLKAQGHSYREISELTGWSYTKVNRCLTEGRRRFLDRYAGIESGEECDRWAPLLSAIADGEAEPADIVAVRPHLRNCPACRAALRDFQAAPSTLASLVPVAGLAFTTASSPRAPGALARVYEAVVGGASDRLVVSAQKLQAGLEVASSGKLAAFAVSVTALGGSAVAINGQPLTSGGGTPHRHLARPSPRADRASRASHLVSQAASEAQAPAIPQPQPTTGQSSASPAPSASTSSPTPAAAQAAEFGAEGSQSAASTAAGTSAASTPSPARASPASASASSGGGGEFSP